MENLDSSKVAYLFDGLKGITTKLENLNDEFKHVKDRNPIHYIKSIEASTINPKSK